ncbi:PH domain-containing protein [Pseudonocardia bannensis]|uniref:PH domain-containing protein n=1 Tax=Pseudonocardia bannensis TaxID=630973 RepID=A0A848DFM6_9PSEU|nr:PH domain-containing protein [Pseudonocardia bannensis]NMH91341.1 PH domain-containing protein [Pseudonocardia bannensis]
MGTGGTSAPAPGGTVRLRPPRNPLDARAVGWWRTHCLLGSGATVLTLTGVGLLIGPARLWLAAAAALVLLGGAASVLLPPCWYRLHRWEITDTAVYTRSGYLWQEWRVAPVSRIQTVDMTRGPLQNLFGLTTVVVTTASAKGAVTVAGLNREVAADLAQHLAAATAHIPGDAT